MSATNIAPEIKDKLVEHLNEMLSAENTAVDRLDSRIQECLLQEGKRSNCNTLKMRLEHTKKG